MSELVAAERGEDTPSLLKQMGRMRLMGRMEIAQHVSFMSRTRPIGLISALPLGGQP